MFTRTDLIVSELIVGLSISFSVFWFGVIVPSRPLPLSLVVKKKDNNQPDDVLSLTKKQSVSTFVEAVKKNKTKCNLWVHYTQKMCSDHVLLTSISILHSVAVGITSP